MNLVTIIMANSPNSDSEGEKVKERYEGIGIKDARNMVTKTEDELRNMIDSILTRKHGPNWENNHNIGWSNTQKKSLEKRRKDKQAEFPEQNHSTRLLDYGYVSHLKKLIEKNKTTLELELEDVEKATTYLEILDRNRNPIMHSDNVDEYRKHLCLGTCGYLQQVVKRWKLGYRRKAKRWEADIRLSQPESMGEDAARREAQRLADELAQKLKRKATGHVTEKTESGKTMYKIPINKNKLLIQINKPAKHNYSKRGIFQSANVNLISENFELISETLEELPYKNWTFTWIIPEGLDAIFTIDKIEQIRGIRTSGSKSYVGTELVGRGASFPLQSRERAIRADISGGKGHPTKITLVCGGAGPNDGFANVHNIFSPDEILAICYGERAPVEVLKMLDEACG